MTMNMFATAGTTDYEVNTVAWGTETNIDIDLIKIPDGRVGQNRYRDEDFEELVVSILENGLIHPVVVGKGWTLISGVNRLRAYQHITHTLKIPGFEKIPARTVDADADTNMILEAHENTVRVALSDADLQEMVERAQGAGRSRKQAIQHVADQAGRSKWQIRRVVRIGQLQQDVEDAMKSEVPALTAAAKQVARMLADTNITTRGVEEGCRILREARAELTPPEAPPAVLPPGGNAQTHPDRPAPQPAESHLTTSQRAWRRHLLLVAQEAAVLEGMDVADGVGVLATMPGEFQEQVRATAKMLTRVLAVAESAV